MLFCYLYLQLYIYMQMIPDVHGSSMLMIYLLQFLSLHRRRYRHLKRPIVASLCSSSMTTTTSTIMLLLFLIFQQYPSTTTSTAWILRPPISTSIHIQERQQQQQQQQQKYEPFRIKNYRIHHLLSTTAVTNSIDDDDDNYTNDNDDENNNSKNNTNNHNNFELWEVGNVENDLNNLQQAIIYQNSQQNLHHIERKNTLNHFSIVRHKQSVHNTLYKFILLPLFISYTSSQLFNILLQSKSIILNTISTKVLYIMRLVSMTQFWSILIIAPTILLLHHVRRQNNRNISIHTNSYKDDYIDDHDDDQYNNLQYLISPKDSKRSITTSTRNYIQCILEQWVSCVSTVGITTTIYLFFLSKMKSNNMKIPIIINTLLFVQILTRIGSIASIQQYQSLYYTLLHKYQSHPISWNVWSLQQLISYANNIRWMILDITYLSVLSNTVQQSVLLLLISSILLWLSIISSEKWIQQLSNNNDNNDGNIVQSRLRANQLMSQVHQFTNFLLKLIFPLSIWYCYRQGVFDMIQKILLSHNNNKVISMTAVYLLTALIGPICHLLAICKIIKVRYTHNASLAMNENEFQQYFNSPDKWKWRYMIQWRQPQRIHVTIQQYWQQIWYWLFVRGSVEEQLQHDRRQQIRGTTIKSHRSIILQKVADESLLSSSSSSSFQNNQNDRTKWKELAMQRIAQKHQEDYERGTYDDPLGVAVYRTLGIGLGFNYDHMSPLNSTETPSIRRLQARAAKSAIRRVNELYNADVAKQTLEQITDPVERSKRATAMRQEAEMEVQHLATKLAELIPIDQISGVSASPLQIEQYNTGSYMHTSKHQYTLPSLQTESPALKKLFNEYIVHKNDTKAETYDIDYLNPMGESDQASDDEYITEWLNKYQNSGFVNKENIDDEENTIETMLV